MADRGMEWYGERFMRDVVSPELARKMHQMGTVGVQYAQFRAPFKTGRLRSGISYTYDETTHELSLISEAPWSLFQEFGTYKMPAHPFMRPALQKMAEILGNALLPGGENLSMDFSNATRIKHPEILAHPRNAKHAAIMRQNRATSRGYNYSAAGRAKQYIRHSTP